MPSVVPKAHLPQQVHHDILVTHLRKIFPNDNIQELTKKQTLLKSPSGSYLELDVWIPSHNICFEFQDTYHYITTWYSQRTLDSIQSHDSTKLQVTRLQGNTLIVVPCWWDGKLQGLIATIQFSRPDILLPCSSHPIPLNPPLGFFEGRGIPEIGELMQASFPIDPKFSKSIAPNAWWIGEKYDGVRFCWHPPRKTVYTRTARVIELPNKISNAMPTIFLDGEFWFGRGQFSLTGSLTADSIDAIFWHSMRLITFDVPALRNKNSTFETRYKNLLGNIQLEHSVCIVAPRSLCKNPAHLRIVSEGIIEDGGEGVILRKTSSRYEHGRSKNLLKLKTAYADKEGLVVEVRPSSVILQLPNGPNLVVPATSVHVPAPVKGDIVTFSYEVHARKDLPVNPEICRIRTDVSWEDVLRSAASEQKLHGDSGHEDLNDENSREFMCNLAKGLDLDPLVAKTWRAIPIETICATKTGMAIVNKFRGYVNAVKYLFPEIAWGSTPLQSWNNALKRRKFFEKVAKLHAFDARNVDQWYTFPRTKIMEIKGADRVISYHKGSIARALIDLFPELPFDAKRFWVRPHGLRDRKRFFENYAKANGFDPYNPEHWYLQSIKRIMATKGAQKVLSHHRNSVTRALLELFPDIGFIKSKLLANTSRSVYDFPFSHREARRSFFENYAKNEEFDSLVATNWYQQSKAKIMSFKGAKSVMNFHKNSVSQALCDLYPDIGLEPLKFTFRGSYDKSKKSKIMMRHN